MIDSYKLLANAIVLQAATDWKKAIKEMARSPDLSSSWMAADYMRKQCENFFRSAWCGKLTKLDGIYILERLKKEYKE